VGAHRSRPGPEARGLGGLRLVVEDRGPGVPDAERERIFEAFYRPPGTRESGSGVGLGLALVRRIARLHGGEVCCRPRSGGGTRFEVDLPGAAEGRPDRGTGNEPQSASA